MDSAPSTLRVETGTYDEAADLLKALSLRGISASARNGSAVAVVRPTVDR